MKKDFEFMIKNSIQKCKFSLINTDFSLKDCCTYLLKRRGIFNLPFCVAVYNHVVMPNHIYDTVIKLQEKVTNLNTYNMSFLFFVRINDDLKSNDCFTYFNGNSFIHIVYFSEKSGNLFFDLDFYYSGAKPIKQLIKTIITDNTICCF